MVYAVDVFENREDDLVRKVLTKYFSSKEEALKYFEWYNEFYAPLQSEFYAPLQSILTYADGPYEL